MGLQRQTVSFNPGYTLSPFQKFCFARWFTLSPFHTMMFCEAVHLIKDKDVRPYADILLYDDIPAQRFKNQYVTSIFFMPECVLLVDFMF